jgi:hypothetical protein
MACFGFLTIFPERPLRSLPAFILCIARSTFFELASLYLRTTASFS